MENVSWFTTYRPSSLSQLHLTSARTALEHIAQGSSFPQALLFSGPKGTGKTSSARIIAAMLNDPANDSVVDKLFFKQKKLSAKETLKDPDQANELVQRIRAGRSLVVHEMDAASNRGIDDIRALRERLALPPQEGRVSVYILDEVHMLTNEAFNALLKVLEEPPRHVVFVLATTEQHKIPDTIVSRCVLVRFKKASIPELLQALQPIIKAEQLEVEAGVLELLAQEAQGSFRDAVKLLEQAAQVSKKLTHESVTSLLNTHTTQVIPDLIQAVLDKDASQVSNIIQSMRDQSPGDVVVYRQVMSFIHSQLLLSLGVEERSGGEPAISSPEVLSFLLKELQSLTSFSESIPLLSLELTLLDLVFRSQAKHHKKSHTAQKQSASKPAPEPDEDEDTSNASQHQKPVPESEISPAELSSAPANGQELLSRWDAFLEAVQQKNNAIQAILRSTTPLSGEQGKATIAVYYPFHQEQLQQPRFEQLLAECVTQVLGGPLKLAFVLKEQAAASQSQADTELLELAKTTLV